MNRINLLKSIAAAAICGLLLSACSADAPITAPQISFLGNPKLHLDVANLSVVDQYRSPAMASNVELKHQPTPSGLAHQWAMERVGTTGSSGAATLTILNASVIEEALPGKSGIEGVVGDYPVLKYTARLHARVTVVKPDTAGGSSTYNAEASAWTDTTVLKNDDPNERERTYQEMMRKLAARFDQSLTTEIQRGMGPVLRP